MDPGPGSEEGSVGGVGREDEEDDGEGEEVLETSQALAAVVVEDDKPWCEVACHCSTSRLRGDGVLSRVEI